jgi:hypothetical protein
MGSKQFFFFSAFIDRTNFGTGENKKYPQQFSPQYTVQISYPINLSGLTQFPEQAIHAPPPCMFSFEMGRHKLQTVMPCKKRSKTGIGYRGDVKLRMLIEQLPYHWYRHSDISHCGKSNDNHM